LHRSSSPHISLLASSPFRNISGIGTADIIPKTRGLKGTKNRRRIRTDRPSANGDTDKIKAAALAAIDNAAGDDLLINGVEAANVGQVSWN
jgi:hypothetical protein